MKKTLLMLVILVSVFGCKKKHADPDPVPDYTASVVGTYVGTYVYSNTSDGSVISQDASHTITVTKNGENQIYVAGCNGGGYGPILAFNLSKMDADHIYLIPINGETSPSQTDDLYTISTKYLQFYVKQYGVTKYQTFYGSKQ